MYKYIFVDLDGTIIDLDVKNFMKTYLYKMCEYINEPDVSWFSNALLESCEKLVRDCRDLTNFDKFWEYFIIALDGKYTFEELRSKCDNYYIDIFPKLGMFAKSREVINETLKILKDKGYKIVLATNPLFPRTATLSRIKWANLDYRIFTYITTYENSKYIKPNPKYYEELLKKFSLKKDQVLMIGNDTLEDLVASTIGIDTYLVTDTILNHDEGKYEPKFQGSLVDLKDFISSFPSVVDNKYSKEIYIDSEFVTLGQLLKLASLISSGAEAKNFLEFTKVYVNGEVESRRGRKLYPNDLLEIKSNRYIIVKS